MKNNTDVARGWMEKALSDLKTAEILLSAGGPTDTCCFHSQQAVEKTFKAFLCVHGVVPEKTHDLEELSRKCRQIVPDLIIDEKIAELTEYAVGLRYDVEFWPDIETAEKAYAMAMSLFNEISIKIGFDKD